MSAYPTVPPNDARLHGLADRIRIDVDAPTDKRHWVREMGRSAAQIKTAVHEVGPLASDVRKYLQQSALYGLTS